MIPRGRSQVWRELTEPARTLSEAPALGTGQLRGLAAELVEARRERRTVPPLSHRHLELALADALRIRDNVVDRRLASGERWVGASLSFGSGGPTAPDSAPRQAWLTDGMLLGSPLLDAGALIQPIAEPKLGVRLGRQVQGPTDTPAALLAAAERVFLCVEIVDSRYDGYEVAPADVIADNCGVSALRIGQGAPPPAEGCLRRCRVEVEVDGAAVVADPPPTPPLSPLEGWHWLANRLTQGMRQLPRGTVLLAPVRGPSVRLGPGAQVRVHHRWLGTLELGVSPWR